MLATNLSAGYLSKMTSYRESLKQDLGALIDTLDLPDLHKRFLRTRWLDQVVWMESAAERANRWYRGLRVLVIVGGILIPALLSLNLGGAAVEPLAGVQQVAAWTAFGLGLLVAICAAIEEFFKFGERWRHYRQRVEMLKIEGWLFLQLSGPYRRFAYHLDGYPTFAGRVEGLFRQEVEVYMTDIAREKETEDESRTAPVELDVRSIRKADSSR